MSRITAKQAMRLTEGENSDSDLLSVICDTIEREARKGRNHIKWTGVWGEHFDWLVLNGFTVHCVSGGGQYAAKEWFIAWDDAGV